MTGWSEFKLGELCEIKGGKRLPDGHVLVDCRTDHPYIKGRDIRNGKISRAEIQYITDNTHDKIKRYIVRANDVCVTIVANIGDVGIVPQELDGANLTENAVRLTNIDKSVYPQFLNQLLSSQSYKAHMELLAAGAAQAKLGIYKLKIIKVRLPERKEQEKIAAILSAYDDLIENNRRRIVLLEKMAEEIYREWFVRMRFPVHEQAKFEKGVPEGWDIDVASKFFGHVKGKSYAGDELTDNPEHMPFITLKSFNRGGGYRANGLKHYSGKYKEEQVVQRGDVVMAVTDMTQNREVVGRVARIPEIGEKGAVISLDVIKLTPKTVSASFLYSYMRFSGFGEFIKEFANGTNVLHLKPELVTRQKIVIPPQHLRERFVAIVDPIYDKIDALNEAADRLSASRDMLLPRLISGKLDVTNLDIQCPPSMLDTPSPQPSPGGRGSQAVVHA